MNKVRKNKKGFMVGSHWIWTLILTLMAFVLIVGFIDIAKVEFFTPLSDSVREMTINISGNNSAYVTAQNTIHTKTDSVSLPYNIVLMFITLYLIVASIVDVSREERQGFFGLFLGTIGGGLFLIYFFHIFVVGMLSWFEVQMIGQLFGELINTEVPFYNVLFDNWWFLIVWAFALSTFNRIFGKEPTQEELF